VGCAVGWALGGAATPRSPPPPPAQPPPPTPSLKLARSRHQTAAGR
jgi:hypothetical protein